MQAHIVTVGTSPVPFTRSTSDGGSLLLKNEGRRTIWVGNASVDPQSGWPVASGETIRLLVYFSVPLWAVSDRSGQTLRYMWENEHG